MELRLVVLEGAKQGLKIPLKKDKFLIGRAKECSLRAGSEAISRRHCAIVRKGDRWTVQDLGSRNGTYVNDKKITEEVPLNVGDELTVGPLKFRVAQASEPASQSGASPKSSSAAAAPSKAVTKSPEESKPRRQPPVKDMADVVQRSMSKSGDSATEDDISRWLLGLPDPNGEAMLKETRTIQLEETRAHGRIPVSTAPAAEETQELTEESAEPSDAEDEAEDAKSSRWGFFKRGKGSDKKKPGKLPPRPEQAAKDSREAAADILREMTRRR